MVGGTGPSNLTSTAPMGPCQTCGKPLGGEPWWVVRPGVGEHDRCRDWTRQPFPFARDLARLRVAARSLKDLERCLVETGKLLAQSDKVWPDDASRRVECCRAAMERLRERWESFVARGNPAPRA